MLTWPDGHAHREVRAALRTAAGLLAAAAIGLPGNAWGEIAPPRPLGKPVPAYPAAGGGKRVKVRLAVTVGEDGSVRDATVETLDPADAGPAFSEAAVAFTRGVRFEPARQDGKPVAVQIEWVVDFVPPPPSNAEPTLHTEVEAPRPVPVVAASDFTIVPGLLRLVPRRDAVDLLTLAPGILLTNHGGEGHAASVFLRGFDAGEGQDLEMLVDGVPINEPGNPHGHGYADTSFIIPELVRSLRVVEGPFDPRQGDFAVAGSAGWELGLPERGLRLQGEGGSYAAGRALLLWGPDGQPDGTFVGIDLRRGDGFGPNRAYLSGSAMAGWEARVGSFQLELLGTVAAQRFESAGVIRKDDLDARRIPGCGSSFDQQFFCTYDPDQGGSGSRQLLLARLRGFAGGATLEQRAWIASRSLSLRQDFTGYFTNPFPRGDATEARYQANTFGLSGSARVGPLGRYLEVGYEARRDEGSSLLLTIVPRSGVPFATQLDEGLTLTQVSAFLAGGWQPVSPLLLRAGLRLDSFFDSVLDHNQPTTDRTLGTRLPLNPVDASGIAAEPRASVEVTLAPKLFWITNYGLGARSTDPAALSQGETAPFARVEALDTGLLGGVGPVQARAVAYASHVDRDFLFDPTSGRNVEVGGSNRYGALAAAGFIAGPFDAQGSFTWAEAHLLPPGTSAFDLGAGPRLPYVPRFLLRLDGAATVPLPWQSVGSLAAGVTYVAPRPLPLDQIGDPLFLVDASAFARRGPFELGLRVENLFDSRWASFESNYPSNFQPQQAASQLPELHMVAGNPRLLMLVLAVILDPEGRP